MGWADTNLADTFFGNVLCTQIEHPSELVLDEYAGCFTAQIATRANVHTVVEFRDELLIGLPYPNDEQLLGLFGLLSCHRNVIVPKLDRLRRRAVLFGDFEFIRQAQGCFCLHSGLFFRRCVLVSSAWDPEQHPDRETED